MKTLFVTILLLATIHHEVIGASEAKKTKVFEAALEKPTAQLAETVDEIGRDAKSLSWLRHSIDYIRNKIPGLATSSSRMSYDKTGKILSRIPSSYASQQPSTRRLTRRQLVGIHIPEERSNSRIFFNKGHKGGGGYGKGHQGGGGYGKGHGGYNGKSHGKGSTIAKGYKEPPKHVKPAPYYGPQYSAYDLLPKGKAVQSKKGIIGDDPVRESAKGAYDHKDYPIKHFGGFGGGGSIGYITKSHKGGGGGYKGGQGGHHKGGGGGFKGLLSGGGYKSSGGHKGGGGGFKGHSSGGGYKSSGGHKGGYEDSHKGHDDGHSGYGDSHKGHGSGYGAPSHDDDYGSDIHGSGFVPHVTYGGGGSQKGYRDVAQGYGATTGHLKQEAPKKEKKGFMSNIKNFFGGKGGKKNDPKPVSYEYYTPGIIYNSVPEDHQPTYGKNPESGGEGGGHFRIKKNRKKPIPEPYKPYNTYDVQAESRPVQYDGGNVNTQQYSDGGLTSHKLTDVNVSHMLASDPYKSG